MRTYAWDSWAFLEVFYNGARAPEVQALLREADVIVTVREVVAETFNFIVRKSGSTAEAWKWWAALAQGRVRVFEPTMKDIREFVDADSRKGSLSFTDYALALVARRERVDGVATEDREFRKLGAVPLFARG